MTSDHVFGSHELTPELLRATTFTEVDGRVDASEVRTFLDRVASSLEVFMSGDAPTALRAEFDRNAAIATQILDAGQTASEQLRRQAAEEAKRILDEAREATLGLRETVETEINEARTQVESMRGGFIQDLRDLYDRIGASLYRFERAAEDAQVAPIAEPSRASAPSPSVEATAADPAPEFRNERAERPATPAEPGPPPAPAGAPELPEGAKPPAWQQLPPEAYSSPEAATPAADAPPTPAEVLEAEVPDVSPDAGGDAGAGDPFAPVVEDEPLAPGEPLVDLRSTFGATVEDVDVSAAAAPAEPAAATEPAATPAPAAEPAGDLGGSWLDQGADVPPVAPQVAPGETTAAGAPAGTPTDPGGGSWLDTPLDPDPDAGQPADPALARDDALANALIGEPGDAGDGGEAAAAEQPAAIDVPPGGASPDAVAVRQLILDSLASGQTREAVETYLREHMGLLEPGALVDAALASADQPPG